MIRVGEVIAFKSSEVISFVCNKSIKNPYPERCLLFIFRTSSISSSTIFSLICLKESRLNELAICLNINSGKQLLIIEVSFHVIFSKEGRNKTCANLCILSLGVCHSLVTALCNTNVLTLFG